MASRALKPGYTYRVALSWGEESRPLKPHIDHSLDKGLDIG